MAQGSERVRQRPKLVELLCTSALEVIGEPQQRFTIKQDILSRNEKLFQMESVNGSGCKTVAYWRIAQLLGLWPAG